jgi:hypothetical protein
LSSPRYFEDNIQLIRGILEKNNYPDDVVFNVVKKFRYYRSDMGTSNRIQVSSGITHNARKFSGVTFIPKFTERLTKSLASIDDKIGFGYKPFRKVSDVFTNTKTRLDPRHKHGLVYRIDCCGNDNENCDKMYIGETSRPLEKRMKEHQNDYKNRHKKDVGQSALIKHCKEKGHFFDFENVKVLHHEENFYRRRFLESSSIQYNKPLTVNYKTDTNNLNVLYSNILNKHRALGKKTRKK